jgi:hypothetical protein
MEGEHCRGPGKDCVPCGSAQAVNANAEARLFNPARLARSPIHQKLKPKGGIMAQSRHYSPRLERPLITALYHAAKARRIPMTRLASSLVREGLERIADSTSSETAFVREEPFTPPQPAQK